MDKVLETDSYKKTIKTSGVLGFSQLIAIAFTVVRTKIITLILGSSGYGTFSIYYRLMDFVNATCQVGTGMGAISEISKARAQNDQTEVDKFISLLRFWIIFISSIAFVVIIAFSRKISSWQFGTDAYSTKLIIIALAIVFANFYNIHISLLTGLREIKKIAQAQIFSSLGGLVLAVPFIYFFKKDGIEWSILVVSFANALVMFYFMRKLKIKTRIMPVAEVKKKVKAIFKVGISYALPGVLYTFYLYLTNIYLQHKFGLKMVGIYQSCMVLSSVYVQTIINAMAADYRPALMEKRNDNKAFNRYISQQIELGVLVASVGVLATYILAPYVLLIFYSKEFLPGTYILRWQVLAVFLRVMEYPLGFATTAKGKNIFYLIFQSSYITFEFGLLILFTWLFGFKGLGSCYLVSYSIFFVARYITVKRFSNYQFTSLIKKQLWVIAFTLIIILLIDYFCVNVVSLIAELFVLCLFIFWSYKVMTKRMEIYPKEILCTFLSRFKK